MPSANFSIVDVFSTTAYKGNPLAVVDDLNASLTDTQMKLIARQFNLSETTFVNPPTIKNASHRLRSFLPDGKEVFGAGHNSLGALWWLAKQGHLDSIKPDEHNRLRFNQQMGQDASPVVVTGVAATASSRENDSRNDKLSVVLRQAPPRFHGVHTNPAALGELLGVKPSEIGFEWDGKKFSTPQVVSTATTKHLLVPISNEAVLDSITPTSKERLLKEIQSADPLAYGLYLFTPSAVRDQDNGLPIFKARFFSPGMSGEDPATGSAAGPMAAYLYKYELFELAQGTETGSEQKITVLQGVTAGRACYLTITVGRLDDEKDQAGDRETVSTSLSGDGVEVSKGTLVVPGLDVEF